MRGILNITTDRAVNSVRLMRIKRAYDHLFDPDKEAFRQFCIDYGYAVFGDSQTDTIPAEFFYDYSEERQSFAYDIIVPIISNGMSSAILQNIGVYYMHVLFEAMNAYMAPQYQELRRVKAELSGGTVLYHLLGPRKETT